MLRVSNKTCIRSLATKSFRSSKSRNCIAILAIALTTILFTSLFTVGLSLNEGFQQSNFRQAGGYAHGGFKYLTQEQFQELQHDPLIKEWGVRRVIGMGTGSAFRKNHVEVGWANANTAHWMWLDPIEGRLPKEGTQEAATDLEVLRLLGVEPKIGAKFTIPIALNDQQVTEQTFTLCGWWEKDPVVVANHILIPEKRVNDILKEENITLPTKDKLIGSWNMDVMFQNDRHIEKNLNTILKSHGYQCEEPGDNYINIGVNWGYSNAQFAEKADAMTIIFVFTLLALIIFTGYLIIYNIFQISVVHDIRYYGLLKTIGTTGKQIKAILRYQALLLCIIGIPLGCIFGWFIGAKLCPLIFSRLNGIMVDTVSASPLIFIGAALFAIFTVLLSCAKPGRTAAKISPIEAVRYMEGEKKEKHNKKNKQSKAKYSNSFSLFHMAKANLGRNKGRTFVTILSLTLAVVLLQATTMFTNGFDMDKYLEKFSTCDFVVSDAEYFQNNWSLYGQSMDSEIISAIEQQGGIVDSGRVYREALVVQDFITEDWYRKQNGRFYSTEEIDEFVKNAPRTAEGLMVGEAQTYGMEDFALDHLDVYEGDLSGLYEPGSHEIAAVYKKDDYGNISLDSHWAKLGDTITLRFVEEWEYYDPKTGVTCTDSQKIEAEKLPQRPTVYKDIDFTVTALVDVPQSFSYRYYGNDEFVMNADTFKELHGTANTMLYAFNTTKEANGSMEAFLKDYTNNINPDDDYESKTTYQAEFNKFRSMFQILGSLLSFIVGLIGILNFVNAILTGILTRKREFAMLQSIGMTGRQLKKMLIYEGILYSLGAVLLAFLLFLAAGPMAASVLSTIFWFFTYRPTFLPLLVIMPIFALLGCIVPLLVYHCVSKQTIVERLRETDY